MERRIIWDGNKIQLTMADQRGHSWFIIPCPDYKFQPGEFSDFVQRFFPEWEPMDLTLHRNKSSP